jgi:hypothetical protein
VALSIRERILQAISSILETVALTSGATLIRSPTTPVTREQSPALLLIPESDQVTKRANDRVEHQLTLRLTALARTESGFDAHGVADALLVASHLALFANPNFDGLVIGLEEIDCDWQEEDADADLAAMPARYQITYRTLAADISQLG